MITPNTIVKLYTGIPCDPTYQNVLHFDSLAEQIEYFSNILPVATYTDFNFIDNTKALRVKRNIENCYNINYVAYQNKTFGNKWFYAFVTDMEYASPESTLIYLEEDVWATWQFNVDFHKSFIERECVSDDTIGLHTVEENVKLGDYITTTVSNQILSDYSYVILATERVSFPEIEPKVPQIIGGLPCPCYAYFCGENMNIVNGLIEQYSNKPDAIIAIFAHSPELGSSGEYTKITPITFAERRLSSTVRNNKMYTHPYCGLVVEGDRNSVTLKYELFSNEATGNIIGNFGVNESFVCYPLNYAGKTKDFTNAVSVGHLPPLAWVNNRFQNWLGQEALPTVISGVTSIATGAMYGGAFGATVNGVKAVGELLYDSSKAVLAPDTLRGQVSGNDVMASAREKGFRTYCQSIKPEYIKIIDNYFSMFGYKVSTIKNIELHSRRNWNYIKTINANITGDCPAPQLKDIKNMLDSGVTLWHNGNFNYGDLSNPII